jgi:glycosyltransferase involved in cell wall biosynthesis
MTLRVLHVVTTMNRRGGELFASDLVRALDSDGIDQKVAVLNPPNGMVRVTFEAPTLVVRDGWRTPGLRTSVGAVRALGRLVSDWRPDVVQAHGGGPFKYLAFSGAGGQSQLVYRRIGAAPQSIRHGPRRVAHAILMRRAAEVVTVAEAVRKETLEVFRVPPARVRMIPNGVDPARLKPGRGRQATREALGIAADAHIIVSLGALTWEKDPLTHLSISARVLQELPDVVHLFVGDGPLRFRAERAAQALGIQERTIFLGSREDVPDLLNASDVMLLASATEGMPGGAIEAGMMGLPVAAYALAGIPEAVIDGATGRLASPGDQEALTNHLLEMLTDPAGRRRLGRNARQRCMSLFDMAVIAPKYRALYEELASRASTSRSSPKGVW